MKKKLLILFFVTLFASISCNQQSSSGTDSKTTTKKPEPTSAQEQTPTPAPTKTQVSPVVAPAIENKFEEVDIDAQRELSKLIDRNSKQNSTIYDITNNHQLSTLISKIIFNIDPDDPSIEPTLTLRTRGKDYNLKIIQDFSKPPRPNHYDFAYVEDNTSSWDNFWNKIWHRETSSHNQNPFFKVSVDIYHFDNKLMASMEIIDEDPNDHGILNVIYLRKKGTFSIDKSLLSAEQLKKINDDPPAYHLLELLTKKTNVVGEFYYMTTDPTSNATQFRLVLSNNFSLTTDAAMSMANVLAQEEYKTLPLNVQNIHNFNYLSRGIDSADYEIMSRKIPVVLRNILLKLNIKTSDDRNDNIPLNLMLKF